MIYVKHIYISCIYIYIYIYIIYIYVKHIYIPIYIYIVHIHIYIYESVHRAFKRLPKSVSFPCWTWWFHVISLFHLDSPKVKLSGFASVWKSGRNSDSSFRLFLAPSGRFGSFDPTSTKHHQNSLFQIFKLIPSSHLITLMLRFVPTSWSMICPVVVLSHTVTVQIYWYNNTIYSPRPIRSAVPPSFSISPSIWKFLPVARVNAHASNESVWPSSMRFIPEIWQNLENEHPISPRFPMNPCFHVIWWRKVSALLEMTAEMIAAVQSNLPSLPTPQHPPLPSPTGSPLPMLPGGVASVMQRSGRRLAHIQDPRVWQRRAPAATTPLEGPLGTCGRHRRMGSKQTLAFPKETSRL